MSFWTAIARRTGLVLLTGLVSGGCASRGAAPAARTSVVRTTLAPLPSADLPASGKEGMSLEQIEPVPVLGGPATRPDAPAPVEAVRLFAQARIAMLDGNRAAAIDLLEKAAALDPESFQLHSLLGDLYGQNNDARAQAHWEKAAAVEPDHLGLQVTLGRQELTHAKFDAAVGRLRLARQTTEYRHDDPAAAEADFLLARALQEGGYDRAALEAYERLLGRLESQQASLRRNAQSAALLAHPEALALHVAALYEKHRQYGQALTVLKAAAARNPDDFDVQAQVVRDTAAVGRAGEAVDAAAELVQRFHASRASLALLRETAGDDATTSAKLEALRRRIPDDRAVVSALFESMRTEGRGQDAAALMDRALAQWPNDLRLIRRQFEALHADGRLDRAAVLMIEALARRPDDHLELTPLWDRLSRPSAHGRLRGAQVEVLAVSSGATAAKLMLAARSARLDRGEAAERQIIARAVDVRPVFAPAWRQALLLAWANDAMGPPQKIEESAKLADAAEKAGEAALADELRAQSLLDQERAEPAALGFAKAVRDGDRSPELYLNFATALHLLKDEAGARSLLVKLIGERPLCQEAYLSLYEIYQSQELPAQAGRLLRAWLAADPESPAARRLEAREALAQHRYADARAAMLHLLERRSYDPEVLAAVQEFFAETHRTPELTDLLRRRLAAEPWNFFMGQALAQNLQLQNQTEEAVRVASGLEPAVAGDADLLYLLSGLYTRLGADGQSERALNEVLRIEPAYAGANNDLGYLWLERGRELGRAEDMIRKAVAAEPDNPSFLDSLGWVLYKRGRFDEALRHLTRAAEPAEQADPVVLDHLGDTLYRLGNRDQAARNWQQASKRLAATPEGARQDLKDLRTALLQKQQDLTAGRPVSVAPVLEKEVTNEK